jgi:hypothetical protein
MSCSLPLLLRPSLVNGLFPWRLVKKHYREALSARPTASSAINGRISTHTSGLALAGVIHQGPFQIQRQWNLVPRSAGPSLSTPARLFLVLCREKHKSCPCKRTDARAFHQAGMGMGRWSSNSGRRAVEAPLLQACEQ